MSPTHSSRAVSRQKAPFPNSAVLEQCCIRRNLQNPHHQSGVTLKQLPLLLRLSFLLSPSIFRYLPLPFNEVNFSKHEVCCCSPPSSLILFPSLSFPLCEAIIDLLLSLIDFPFLSPTLLFFSLPLSPAVNSPSRSFQVAVPSLVFHLFFNFFFLFLF